MTENSDRGLPSSVNAFSGAKVYEWAKDRLEENWVPIPNPPKKTEDANYDFPEDPNELGSVELGQMMLRMASYGGRRNVQLGIVESELVALGREMKLKVGAYGLAIRQEIGGRPSYETVEAAVLAKHEDLIPLYGRISQLEVIKAALKPQIETYNLHWAALSRELSRRFDESRSGG